VYTEPALSIAGGRKHIRSDETRKKERGRNTLSKSPSSPRIASGEKPGCYCYAVLMRREKSRLSSSTRRKVAVSYTGYREKGGRKKSDAPSHHICKAGAMKGGGPKAIPTIFPKKALLAVRKGKKGNTRMKKGGNGIYLYLPLLGGRRRSQGKPPEEGGRRGVATFPSLYFQDEGGKWGS